MGRNAEKTQNVADEVVKLSRVETRTLIFDFNRLHTQDAVRELNELLDGTKDLDISILINNIGQIMYGRLEKHSVAERVSNLSINVNAITYMSMYFVPRLLARSKKSAIINPTSKMAYLGFADFGPYGASKAYFSMLT